MRRVGGIGPGLVPDNGRVRIQSLFPYDVNQSGNPLLIRVVYSRAPGCLLNGDYVPRLILQSVKQCGVLADGLPFVPH